MTTQSIEKRAISLEQELIALERQFWSGKPEVYFQHADEECLIAFPQMAGVIRRDEIAQMAEEGRWSDVSINKKGLLQISDSVAIFTYEARAKRREGEPYHALVSSAYVKQHDGWKLAFHQQTPMQ